MHFFKNPAFSTGTGGMILVFVSMYGVMFLISQYFQLVLGYSAAHGCAAPAADRARSCSVVAPFTPRLSARFGAHRTVVVRDAEHRTRPRCSSPGSTPHTPYAYVVVCVVPLDGRHRALDVADDRVDHDGGARAPSPAARR